ncbi:IclR family transcriptional regulator [soil metagenome]
MGGNVRDNMTEVQSVVRSIALLRQVAIEPAGLVSLATVVDLPTTTASRLLHTLERVEAVRRDDRGVYRIGPTITALAASDSYDSFETSLSALANPHMIDLVSELNEAVGLCIPAGDQVVTISQVDASRAVQAEDWTGSRWPLHLGGSGDVMMVTWPAEEVDERLVAIPDADADRVRARLECVRDSGVSWSRGDYVEDLSSVAVAIVNGSGRAIGALLAYGPSYRFPANEPIEQIEDAVRVRAERVSQAWYAGTGRIVAQ